MTTTELLLARLHRCAGVPITRIVEAIENGTDTESLRLRLRQLEVEKAVLESSVNGKRSRSSDKSIDVKAVFLDTISRLENRLNEDGSGAFNAKSSVGSLIDRIVLDPQELKGERRVLVHAKPDAIYALAGGDPDEINDWMITLVAEEGLEPPTRGL